MKKFLKKINKVFFVLCIIVFILSTVAFSYFIYAINTINKKEIEIFSNPLVTEIYDSDGRKIEDFNTKENEIITYNQIPQNLINALISIEDQSFFTHKGVDFKAVIRSFFNNITSSKRQGGSTITQQLVKNLVLTNEVSIKRKIQEAYLSYELENKYTKEQILELYFNKIYFDATMPGISYASHRFFDKKVELLTLPECALLAGLVKSPSLYSPFKYIERANERKNIVLKRMYELNYINENEFNAATNFHAKDFVIEKGSNFEEKNYQYQAYLDVVYEEAKAITSYSPFDRPMRIETFLDTALQKHIDEIQEGKAFDFNDNLLQIAACVIDNKNSGITALSGGRNYNGMLLYNRSFNMQRQPASTMKPIFTYALAMEYLNFHEYTMIKDEPYTYPKSNITVHNADKKYLGNITLTEALGYSRNTSTLFTLEKIINKIGEKKVVDYLKSIDLMDNGTFSYPYAIGGMTYGVTPIKLCNAYSVLPRGGIYKKASTIKKITFLDTNEVVYEHEKQEEKRVLSEESAYLITSTLNNIRDNNYLNINQAFPEKISCVGKTGTNAYDKNTITKYNYPSNADKDIWFAGYSPNYTVVTWTGFDEPEQDKKTYFTSNDIRKKYAKQLFKTIMQRCEIKEQKFVKPETMINQQVVVTKDGTFLPNTYVPEQFLKTITVKKEKAITNVLETPCFKELSDYSPIYLENEIFFSLPEIEEDVYTDFFGNKGYYVTYHDLDFNSETFFFNTNEFFIPIKNEVFAIEIIETYENNQKLHGTPLIISTY